MEWRTDLAHFYWAAFHWSNMQAAVILLVVIALFCYVFRRKLRLSLDDEQKKEEENVWRINGDSDEDRMDSIASVDREREWPGQGLLRRIVRVRDLRRRHSTGPFQLVSNAAKGLLASGNKRLNRQVSVLGPRMALPPPPTEFFEPSEMPQMPSNLKPEIFYILHSLKMLELPTDWHLDLTDIEIRNYQQDEYVFRPGNKDDCLIVVLEGTLAVNIQHEQIKKEYCVKYIEEGASVMSVLSMLDILAGNDSMFKTVSAKAVVPTRVAKYKLSGFRTAYLKKQSVWTRPIEIILTRLLHVTMTTLHQYLGLTSELVKTHLDGPCTTRASHRSTPSCASTSVSGGRARRASGPDVTFEASDINATARKWFAEALGLTDPQQQQLLNGKFHIETYPEQYVLVRQGSKDEQKLMMVYTGSLVLMQERDESEEEENWIGTVISSGELVGGLQLLTAEPAFFTVKTRTVSVVLVMSGHSFNQLATVQPGVVLTVAHSVLRRVSPFLRGIDFALDWILLDYGQALYRQGDVADCLYVVLSGRLRSVIHQDMKKTVVEEFGRGDMVGMIEVLQKKPRSTTVLAVRYSQLARVPDGLLNFIKLKYPQVGFRMVRLLGHYYTSYHRRLTSPNMPPSHTETTVYQKDPMAHIKNLRTLAIVPASIDAPLVPFTCELYHALNVNLNVLRLSSSKVIQSLGVDVLHKRADFRLMRWLNMQEDSYPLVIYECDYNLNTKWTRRCLRQADALLVIANGHSKIQPQPKLFSDHLELTLRWDSIRTNKELILLWPENIDEPTGTYEWLKSAGWFSGHHHVRAPNRMYSWIDRTEATEESIISYYEQNIFPNKVDFYSDFSRLARILTGNAVGLVLGGGGARGAAHVGIIKAMREHGIPIDIVGGVSIGALIGALYCQAPQMSLIDRARTWFTTMSSVWKKVWDLTYWHSAMFTGHSFNESIRMLFGEKDIEDLWLPYFCITTDISASEMRVHREGCLWRYCRASMSLAGYLPPLCDPADGHLLLDGGYVNNLPADVMRSLGARCVIAVDVGAATETDLYNYGDCLSGTWLLLRRLNPFSEPRRILGMEEIQSRLAFVSCVRQLQTVKNAPYCHYLRPPIHQIKTLDFARFHHIYKIGHDYGKSMFKDLVKSNENIKNVMHPDKLKAFQKAWRREISCMDRSLTTSFTDLAVAMSKVPAQHPISPEEIHITVDESISEDNELISETELSELEEADEADDGLLVRTPRKLSAVMDVFESLRST